MRRRGDAGRRGPAGSVRVPRPRTLSVRRSATFGVVALLLSGLAGCGIPDQTDVRVDGRGPVADVPQGDRPGGSPPPGRTASGSDQDQFARNFLSAAAGEASEAYQRVNQYILAGLRFVPKSGDEGDINIVRILNDGPTITRNNDGTSQVKIDVQQVGVLRANGSIGEPVAAEPSYTFEIGAAPTDPGPGDGLWVLKPPPVLLMTVDALDTYYEVHTIYFWNKNGDALLPDLRYLPRAVPVERQATEMLDWLIGGPSDWLNSAAARLPDGTGMVGNVPAPKEGGRLEVNLSVKAGALDTESELKKLFTQIVWSLRKNPLLDNELELKIQNQSKMIEVAADYRGDNPIYQLGEHTTRYAVLAGSVYPLIDSAEGAPTPAPIPAEVNRDVVAAGMSRHDGRVSVALVVQDGSSLRLCVGEGPGTVRDFRTINRAYASIGRPVWLKEAGAGRPTGLVVADGRLFQFDTGSPALTEVPHAGAPGQLTAVGASLDGHRIAFVAGGALYVAAVRAGDGSLNVGPARRLATSLTGLTAVDWFGENSLAVAGLEANGQAAVYQLSVDGVRESQQVNAIGAPVTQLAAYPNDLDQHTPAPLLYEANQVAYANGTPIDREDVSPGSGPLPTGTAVPTAPFYLY